MALVSAYISRNQYLYIYRNSYIIGRQAARRKRLKEKNGTETRRDGQRLGKCRTFRRAENRTGWTNCSYRPRGIDRQTDRDKKKGERQKDTKRVKAAIWLQPELDECKSS